MRYFCIAALAVFLSACSTPYGKYGILGGYTDTRIDENTFSISNDTNGFTSQQTTSMQALYRAAELTIENGFDFFVIGDSQKNSTGMAMIMPGTTQSTTTYGTTRTTSTPTTAVPMFFPNSTLVFKTFKGVKPEGAPNAYDARAVMRFLGPQLGI